MEKAKEAAHGIGGFLSGVKTRLHIDDLVAKVRDSKNYLIDMALYGGIGFIAGCLIKRYSVYVVIMILMGVALATLQHFDLIQVIVNFDQIKSIMGVESSALNDDTILGLVCAWLKMHVVISVSFVIGFLIGLICA